MQPNLSHWNCESMIGSSGKISPKMHMMEVSFPTRVQVNPSFSPCPPCYWNSHGRPKTRTKLLVKMETSSAVASSPSSFSASGYFNQTVGRQSPSKSLDKIPNTKRKRVFFLDVNPLCYAGSTPSLHSFGHWMSLFFSQVSLNDPVIAVVDGERGSEHRRKLLPSYKAHRWKFLRNPSKGHVGRSHQVISDFLSKCNVPLVRIGGHEADDVVATLVDQALQKGHRVVIASPDKDFKQLLSEDVQIVMPLVELKRWSFYTLKHYMSQYNCDPCSDLSLRCMLGDEVDGVPGIQHVVPEFGRKTALKLLKKHGSLENLLNTAAVRTVGKQYAQDALTKYADYLRRNYQVLALRKDVNVQLQEEWLVKRDSKNDSASLSGFFKMLEETKNLDHHHHRHTLSNG